MLGPVSIKRSMQLLQVFHFDGLALTLSIYIVSMFGPVSIKSSQQLLLLSKFNLWDNYSSDELRVYHANRIVCYIRQTES